MKNILSRLFEYHTFTQVEARQILTDLASGKYSELEMAAFLAAFCMRSITVDELAGFRDAMLDLCVPLDFNGLETIDLCGTGGDGKHTFNISTLASFVTAASGLRVAKHGNYGVSSVSGSSNVMECLGYRFPSDVSEITESIEKAGICFLHAPLFHPAMKRVGPIRRELGVKTFFNMLGPLVNPARPRFQLAGVFSLELARLYYYLYQQDASKHFSIIHTVDGYDEVSLTAALKVYSNQGESLLQPQVFAGCQLETEQISGGETVQESARIFMDILEGKGTEAQNAVVCWNSAFALLTAGARPDLDSCHALAAESLASGKALGTFKALMELNHRYARA